MTTQTFETAYGLGYPRTVAFLRSRGVQRESAIELAQGAWARGWEKLSQLRDDSMLITWVNRIALNLHLATFRRRLREEALSDAHLDRAVTVQPTERIELALLLSMCRACDRSLLEGILAGATIREIADRERTTPTTIRIRLMRARRRVRDGARQPMKR